MAKTNRICSVEGCCKPARKRGWCSMHYRRWLVHGDVNYVMPMAERQYPNRKRPKKFFVKKDWLAQKYAVERRPVGEIASEIGCTREHLKNLIRKFGIPTRDGRKGAVHLSRRADVNVAKAAWMYEILRMSCEDIGKDLGVDKSTVMRRLKETGVKLRHHNDTKRGARAHREIERDVAKQYAKEAVSIETIAGSFNIGRDSVVRILADRGISKWAIGDIRDWRGEKSPRWRHDLTDEERDRRRDSNKQTAWRHEVYSRDQYKCQRCGDDRGGNLHAHHIEAYCEHKSKRWDINNGITLCEDCHKGFHSTYGFKGFGQKELSAYLSMEQQ